MAEQKTDAAGSIAVAAICQWKYGEIYVHNGSIRGMAALDHIPGVD
jgi:hypothetical protein